MAVTGRSDDRIHFGCSRCTAPLVAPRTQIGRTLSCPLCHTKVLVPKESRKPWGEQYAVSEREGQPPAATEREIAFNCVVCNTRMTAPESQVGETVACPDCRTPAIVPPRAAGHPTKRAAAVEEYAVHDDASPASDASAAGRPKYFPLHCPRCNTLMHATEAQVGSQLICPDCGMETTILPSITARPPGKPAVLGEYDVREDSASAPVSPWSQPPSFGVYCVVCRTLMQATEDQVGTELTCPDCGSATLVRPRAQMPPTRTPEWGQPGQQYAVGRDHGPPTPEPRWFAWRRPPVSATSDGILPPEPPPAPRWPLLSGVFTFPWYGDCWPQWCALSLWGTLIGYLGYGALLMSNSISAGMGSVGPAILAMLAMAVSLCMAAAWLATISIDGLTIITVTAAGNDRTERWPDLGMFLDWMVDTFFVVNSIAMSASAGWGLALIGCPSGFAVPAVAVLLFPVFLMSMLETNSRVWPFSPLVLRSLFRHKLAWIVFYVETALLAGLAGGITISTGIWAGPAAAIPVGATLLSAALMIYFRLLGRLGWCCTAEPPGREDQ